MSDFPSIDELVPHTGAMSLLERILEIGEDHVVCEVVVRNDGLFDSEGHVPAWLGIEYMAQAIAAFSGLQSRQNGESVRLGYLLGTRRFETSVSNFNCSDVLRVFATRLMVGSSGMGAFECRVEGEQGGVNQTATLSVYQPNQIDQKM